MTITGIDPLRPRVKFEVIGGPKGLSGVDLERALVSFIYEDKRKTPPRVSLKFDNSTGKIFNLGILALGLKLRIRFGYDHWMSTPFIVPIKKIRAGSATFGAGVSPYESPLPDIYGEVEMEAPVHAWKLHYRPDGDRHLAFGLPISKAAREIARMHGYREEQIFIEDSLAADGIPEPIFDQLCVDENRSAAQFLAEFAARRGFIFRATSKEFRFHAEGWRCFPVAEIHYFEGADTLSYKVNADYNLNMFKVKGYAVNPKSGLPVAYVQSASDPAAGLVEVPVKGQTSREDIRPYDVVTTIGARKTEAVFNRLVSHVHNRWQLDLEVVGNAALFPGYGVNLINFGQILDGVWFIREVYHTIDTSGYTTKLQIGAKTVGPGGKGRPLWPSYVYNQATGQMVGLVSTGAGNINTYLDKSGKTRTRRPKKVREPGKILRPRSQRIPSPRRRPEG